MTVIRWNRIYSENNQKGTGRAIFISDEVDVKARRIAFNNQESI